MNNSSIAIANDDVIKPSDVIGVTDNIFLQYTLVLPEYVHLVPIFPITTFILIVPKHFFIFQITIKLFGTVEIKVGWRKN
jgi:hypothetical protein